MSDVKIVKTEKKPEPVKTTVRREVTVTEEIKAPEPKKDDTIVIVKN